MQEANKHGSSTPSGIRRLRITEPATDRPMASLVLATLTNDPQTALAMRTADPEALTAEMLAHEKQRWAPALADPRWVWGDCSERCFPARHAGLRSGITATCRAIRTSTRPRRAVGRARCHGAGHLPWLSRR